MAPITFHRFLPSEGEVEAQALAESLDLSSGAPGDRPYTVANFVVTVDGRAAFQGRSSALGDDGDRAIFHGLRERVDAVLAGTRTLAAERYGRIIGSAERRERRVASGRRAEPLAIVISRSGRIPLEIPLFAEPQTTAVVFSPAASDLTPVAATVHHEPLDPLGAAPLATAMRTLRTKYGVSSLLCEGGPALFGSLLREGLVAELFLTVAPKLAGGESGPAITSGPPMAELVALNIRHLLERDGSLYLRYALSG